jgi:FdhD protein
MGIHQSVQYHRFSRNHGWVAVDAKVIREANVTLTVNGEGWLTFLCTPAQLEELAAGFLYNENVIESAVEIAVIRPCEDLSNVDVWLHHAAERPAAWKRTSGCSGGVTTSDSPAVIPVVSSFNRLDPKHVLACMEQLLDSQEIYRETGGIHCSAVSDGETLLTQAEDIGRHNTLDKLAGMLLLRPPQGTPRIVLTTGRISSEMLQKSARLGAEIVVSRTSPTSESLRLAESAGITLVGYARRSQMNVYTHPERFSS